MRLVTLVSNKKKRVKQYIFIIGFFRAFEMDYIHVSANSLIHNYERKSIYALYAYKYLLFSATNSITYAIYLSF